MAEEDRQTEEAFRDGPMLPVWTGEDEEPPKPERDRFGDTIAEYVEPALNRAVERFQDAGVIDVDEDDPRLLQALQRANDYAGDMAMAGVNVGEATWGAVAGAVGEAFGGSPERERRLARDVMGMPEAFAGTGFVRGANQLDDVVEGATEIAARGLRGLERLGEGAAEAQKQGFVGSNFGNVGRTDAPFDANRGLGGKIPPPENAQRTQIAGTFPTYEKASAILADLAPEGQTLDFGAGLGKSQSLGFDTYEPFPKEGFQPTYSSADDIPDGSYEKITSLNVLNVVPKEARDEIVDDIGRVLKPGGHAVITTRGRDVMSASGEPGPESMSIITGRGTYQKGFTPKELQEYVQSRLGDGYKVENVKLGPAGVVVRKTGFSGGDSGSSMEDVLNARAQEMSRKPKDRIQPFGEYSLFDLSPESYERTLPEQRETYVPRLPEGSNRSLPKGDRGRPVQEMSDQIADRLAERMEPFVGTEAQYFYHTGPIIDKARDLGFSDEEIFSWMGDFADAYAATSPRTETAQNIRNATLALAKRQLGVDLDEVVGPGGDGINEKGYPMMIGESGIHRSLLERTQNGGIDPDTNPKPATFAENVYGNLDGVTVDTHAIRGALDAMNEIVPGSVPEGYIKPKFREQYRSDPSTFDPAKMVDDTLDTQKIDGKDRQTEYAVFSDLYRKAAERLGVSPAEAQSMGWFGSGDRTGLASENKSVARLLEDRIDVTAQATGTDKETVFRKLLNREIPVMSIMPAAPAVGLMAPDDEQRDGFARGGLALSESRKGIKTQAGKDMASKRHQLDRKKADTDGDGTVSGYEKQKAEAVQRAEKDGELPEMACGGIMMDPMMQGVDPVSGNPIPLGSTAENVRDDIPARLSSDEYVLPAHVVKYHGLKHIMSLQEEAELGLMTMDAAGLIPDGTDEKAKSDGEGSEDAEVSEEGRDAEEGEGSEETLETPEGNEIEVAGVETTTAEFEDDETEGYKDSAYPTKPSMYGMMKKPKVTFIV